MALEGFRRKVEGLVHISQLSREGRVENVEDVVSRGQQVKVKVLTIADGKMSLSMKEVDQETGEDLNPGGTSGKNIREKDSSSRNESKDPEVGDIFDGKVQNITGFGCFVGLEGFRRKVEGLVHISQLRKEGRVSNVEEAVSRGQKVKVKVLTITGGKMSLSMRDVDQETGQDLNPSAASKKSREDDLALRNPEHPGFGGAARGHGLLETLRESNQAGIADEDDLGQNVAKKKVFLFIFKN